MALNIPPCISYFLASTSKSGYWMKPPAISKNYGVAGTLLSFGRGFINLNCLLNFTFDKSKSGFASSMLLIYRLLWLSRKFSWAYFSAVSPMVTCFLAFYWFLICYLLSKSISYKLSNLTFLKPFLADDESICSGFGWAAAHLAIYLAWHLHMAN